MEAAPLTLEGKVALGSVSGRIDHLAVDLTRQRLFVAELGNNTVGMIDLKERKVLGRISGFKEPQGLAYHATTDTLYVANGGDGSLRLFSGPDLTPRAQVDLRDDADNIRIDPKGERVIVGYGRGALAVIDPVKPAKLRDIRLDAHPEGFQLDRNGRMAYVNLPNSRKVAIIDLEQGNVIRSVPMNDARSNFPMAVDHDRERILTVFRTPPKLVVLSARDGSMITSADVCGDSDDVFVDAKRRRAYVSCGEGFVDVFDMQDSGYSRIGHIKTVAGARTALWVPELDRLFLAVRASGPEPAAIWVLRPQQ
jgi:DNA-binding beta-propeller fold protein YncE